MKNYADSVLINTNGTITPAAGASVQVVFHSNQANAPLFSDDGQTPTANPVTADSNGRYNFFVADGRYDLKFTGNFVSFTLSNIEIADITEASGGDTPWLVKNLEAVRYVDASNSQGWAGGDFGAWVNSAIADLPTVTSNGTAYAKGKIILAPSASTVTQTTTVNIPSVFVAVEGPGPQNLIIICQLNADCWSVRETPFQNNSGSKIGGFTLVGPGAGFNSAVGLHVGDYQAGVFQDITIANFIGTGSSCLWLDNINGFSERNTFMNLQLGARNAPPGGADRPGCTKAIRITSGTGPSNPSVGYNYWYNIGLTILVSGQTGFSIEGTPAGGTSSTQMYNNVIFANANQGGGSTLFAISNTNAAQTGNFIDVRTESGGSATGWNIASGTNFNYTGPGIVENVMDNNNVFDTIPSNSSTAFYNFLSPTNRRSVSFGIPGAVSMYANPDASTANSFLRGIGWNMYWDGTNWHTKGDSVHNGGAMLTGGGGTVPPQWYLCPSLAGTDQIISNASLSTTCVVAPATISVGFGTSTSNGTLISAGTSQAQPGITINGINTNDVASCSLNASPPASWQTGIQMLPPVVTSNTVTPWLSNPTAGSITPVAAVIRCVVFR